MNNVNGKYLKDENGNTISPVVSTSTVFDSNNTNLDDKLDNFCSKSNVSIITVTLQNNVDLAITTAYTGVTIPFDKIFNNIGDCFTLSGNKITIQKTGLYKISGNVSMTSPTDSGTCIFCIYKNGVMTTSSYSYGQASHWVNLCSTPRTIDLVADDVISAVVSCNVTYTTKVARSGYTFLTIEYIDV